MKQIKWFSMLALVVLVLGGITLYQKQKPHAAPGKNRSLFEALDLSAIRVVEIRDNAGNLRLTFAEDGWQVENRDGYPAAFKEIRRLAEKVKEIKVDRSFSVDPETRRRLLLETPGEIVEGAGKQIRLLGEDDTVLADFVSGKPRETGSRSGQYIRQTGTDTAFLADKSFRFTETTPSRWMEKEFLDIKPEAITSVTAMDATGKTRFVISRKDGVPVLDTASAKGNTIDEKKLSDVFRGLSGLRLTDVEGRHDPENPPAIPVAHLAYRLENGTTITVWPAPPKGENQDVSVVFTLIPSKAASSLDPTKETAKENGAVPDATTLQQQLSWRFQVSSWEAENWKTRLEHLVLKKES